MIKLMTGITSLVYFIISSECKILAILLAIAVIGEAIMDILIEKWTKEKNCINHD